MQGGKNPVYGASETKPPWWPEECIRWQDMVDLRGKPPYLPDQRSFSEVLKIAIERGLKYWGVDPENYYDSSSEDNQNKSHYVETSGKKLHQN
jgi:hypothetical protein